MFRFQTERLIDQLFYSPLRKEGVKASKFMTTCRGLDSLAKVRGWTLRLRSSVADRRVSMPVAAPYGRMPSMDMSMGSMDGASMASMSMNGESPIEHT